MEWVWIILVVGGVTLIIYGINYVVKNLINKGTDAIQNARADKKNAETPTEPTSLADKYK